MKIKDLQEFASYVLKFYANKEIYDIGMTRDEVLLAIGVRLVKKSDLNFYGDSLDREIVRDIVLEMRGY